MATLVKKFGGSSVATPEKMHGIVDRILRERQPDDRIVLVVSAMGDHTDDLLTLAAKVNPEMPKRELDMLLATGEQVSIALMASAFCAKGQPAVSFTGAQAGIKTNDKHSKASILDVQACQVKQALDEGKIVIVAGFQGITDLGQIDLRPKKRKGYAHDMLVTRTASTRQELDVRGMTIIASRRISLLILFSFSSTFNASINSLFIFFYPPTV